MSETLREQQFTLARHLRDPARQAPPPGIEARRLKVYRELFYNAIEGLLAGNFPVLRSTLGDARWHARVRDFYAGHRSQTPLFTGIAEEFVAYLQQQQADTDPAAPWQVELAHYEWVESQLYLSDAQDPSHQQDGDLLTGVPLLSCLAMPLAYRWPVTRIAADHQPTEAPQVPTLLLVHRDAGHQVHFARLAPLAYHLLASLAAHPRSGREHLQALAAAAGGDAQSIQLQGLALLESLRAQGIVIGTQVHL